MWCGLSVFGVGGDSGSSMSTTWLSLAPWNRGLWSALTVVPSFLFSITIYVANRSRDNFLRIAHIASLQWGQRQNDPHKPARYVFSYFILYLLILVRSSPSGAKWRHLARPQCRPNLQELMESSVPSSERSSRYLVTISILKSRSSAMKILALLSSSEQGSRFCRHWTRRGSRGAYSFPRL